MIFQEEGPVNTEAVVQRVLAVAKERGIRHIVVASVRGKTAAYFTGRPDLNIVCVTHVPGFEQDGVNQMDEATRASLEADGLRLVTASHVLSGVERGISSRSGGMYPAEILSNTLRMFGQGVKVCVEVAIMALDAGMIPFGEEVIAVGGSGQGADAAIILKPAHAAKVFDTRICEILCKPY